MGKCIVCGFPVSESEIKECEKEGTYGIYCSQHLVKDHGNYGYGANNPVSCQSEDHNKRLIKESNMADKIFCGSGKKKEFPNGGTITTVNLDMDTLERVFNEYGFTTNGGKRILKVKVSSKRETDQYGNTHSVEIDTWKPDNQGGSNQKNNSYNSSRSSRNVNDDYNPNNDHRHNNKFGSFPGGNNSGCGSFEDDIPF